MTLRHLRPALRDDRTSGRPNDQPLNEPVMGQVTRSRQTDRD
ncbi:hypothetical protein Ae505Ps2_3599c [Pseudonocardia sp. Ae505_Ps2]|nr:hypothetical protein Ae505Ps2_3599c [Pseudonocardia sp. Ae505_Ps2]